ncbi:MULTISPECIES: S9 family peptidase [unclassified Bacillus (in: firmicutes)]|uniref:alpha/beta hydrolase family protein n=1 Tax=unclassified Bacillus (in: firmicutes) TaxID=185979 RepID=UPI0008EC16DD|nr:MULTISPECIES: alpha/beta fold hydrolase [unclassified Bacillus (in: firmicutes)]SFA87826.1 Alpha/beta hydrolase family protein [Bacillus sp. UNCCL13]SFQ84425.1 Alpha/beta hydrolase family protein [Bacillus sp. cl95]
MIGLAKVQIGEKLNFEVRDGVSLEGNLLKPKGNGPYPLVVFVMGSGGETYKIDWEHENFYLCRTIASVCVANGFAFLLVEKRGVEGSGGTWMKQTFEGRADDIYDVIQSMKTREDIISDKISVAGQSQGGWIVQLLAAKYPNEITSALSTAGPVYSVIEQIVDSQTLMWTGKNVNPILIGIGGKLLTCIFNIYKKFSSLKRMGYLSYIIDYDARTIVPEIKTPIFMIFAENDISVPLEKNEPLARKMLSNVQVPYQIRIIPKTNHGFALSEKFQSWSEIKSAPAPAFIETLNEFCTWTKSLTNQYVDCSISDELFVKKG